MRNLFYVIEVMIPEVPREEKEVRAGLMNISLECRYRAPEAQDWEATAVKLQRLFEGKEEEDWAKVVMRIWRNEPPLIWIYQMDDVEWWAGPSLLACKKAFETNSEEPSDELEDARPLSDEEMDRLQYIDIDEEDEETGKPVRRSFREQLAREIADGQEFPWPFAATEW